MPRNPFERFEQLLESMEKEVPHTRVELGGEIATSPLDLIEWDGEFLVIADMPGFEKEDIDLRVTDHTLHIDAEHKAEEEVGEEANYLHQERARTDVSRTVPLPEDIDDGEVSATYENGVLTVTLPKAAEAEEEAHRITVS
ncbi:MAG: Hsp20/alpha crystallin family protein [Halopenitus sp.]